MVNTGVDGNVSQLSTCHLITQDTFNPPPPPPPNPIPLLHTKAINVPTQPTQLSQQSFISAECLIRVN